MITDYVGASSSRGMTTSKEMTDVEGRVLQGILKPKRIHYEHSIIDIELRDVSSIFCLGRKFWGLKSVRLSR